MLTPGEEDKIMKNHQSVPLNHEAGRKSIEDMSAEEVDEELRLRGVTPLHSLPERLSLLIWGRGDSPGEPSELATGLKCIAGGETEEQRKDKEVFESSLKELSAAVADHRIRHTTELLTRLDRKIVLVSPSQKSATRLLLVYAQWIDFCPAYLERVEEAASRFRRQHGGFLSRSQVARLMVIEGLAHLHRENYDYAITHFNYAMQVASSDQDIELAAISQYNLARCYWKKGQYRSSLDYIPVAKEMYRKLGRTSSIAVVGMLEGWLLLLLGRVEEAERLIARAKDVLIETDDYINQGNVLSFYGRLEKYRGNFDEALNYFYKALEAYQQGDPAHRNIARTHANIALAYHLKARDVDAPRDLYLRALKHLDDAERVSSVGTDSYRRGLGRVRLARALLLSNIGKSLRAKSEAEEAYSLGFEKGDEILMGKARRIQWKFAESVTEEIRFAEEACYHSLRTDNRRLQARAFVCRFRSLLKYPKSSLREIQKYRDEAYDRLTSEELRQPYWQKALSLPDDTAYR